MTFGERIKNRRIELNISQEELTERVGYTHRSAISKIEKDKVVPPLDKIESIAKILHCSPVYLAGWSEDVGDKSNVYKELAELKERVAIVEELLKQSSIGG